MSSSMQKRAGPSSFKLHRRFFEVLHEGHLLMHLLVRSKPDLKSAVVKSMLLAAKAVNFDASFRFDHVDTYNPAEMMTPLDEGRVMTAVAEKVQISVALSSLQPTGTFSAQRIFTGSMAACANASASRPCAPQQVSTQRLYSFRRLGFCVARVLSRET